MPAAHPTHIRSRWFPPPIGYVKINFDGAIFSNENKASLGVIIRDSSGLALASCSEILSKAYTSNEVEAIAVANALSFAKDLGFTKAVLKGDSLVVIKALLDEDGYLAPYGLLVEDAKIHSQCFDQLLYSHVKEEGNSVAHCLARYTINIPNFLDG